MNDRFKFRAWNIIVERFQYFDFKELSKMDYKNIQWHILKFQQCTGLKDKNGKLIYEGDVVKQGEAKYVVNWLEGTFCFKGLKTLHNFTIEYVMPSKQEVIGNIYENPELLKECENE